MSGMALHTYACAVLPDCKTGRIYEKICGAVVFSEQKSARRFSGILQIVLENTFFLLFFGIYCNISEKTAVSGNGISMGKCIGMLRFLAESMERLWE